MTESSRRTSGWRRWTVRGIGLVLTACALLLVGVHTPMVRRAVLRRAVVLLRDRFHVDLAAADLSYNLFTLRATLTDLALAATETPQRPFAHASRLTIDLPWSSLYGPLAINDVLVENGRVLVTRRADGSTNLPEVPAQTGEPAALPIERLLVQDLAVEFSDQPSRLSLSFPHISIDVGRARGTVRLHAPGAVARGSLMSRVTLGESDVAFDGRALRIDRLQVATAEASIEARGTIALLVPEPRVDATLSGSLVTEKIFAWLDSNAPVSGPLHVDARIAGPVARPDVTGALRSPALIINGLTLSELTADLHTDLKGVDVRRASASIAGGRATASGALDVGAADVQIEASWSRLDTTRLVRLAAPGARVSLAGTSTGTARLHAPVSDLFAGTISVRNDIAPAAAGPGQLTAPGRVVFTVADRQWRLDAEHTIAGAPVRATLAGGLNGRDVSSSTVEGNVAIGDTDLPAVLRALERAGLLTVTPSVDAGSATGGVHVSGTIRMPAIDGEATVRGLAAIGLQGLTVDVAARGTQRQLAIDATAKQTSDNELHAVGSIWPREARLNLNVTGTLGDFGRLGVTAPLRGHSVVAFTAEGPFDALRGRGTVTVADASYDTVAFGTVDAAIELTPAEVQIDASLAGMNARTRATVSVAAPRRAAIDVTADRSDLARMIPTQPNAPPLAGTVTLRAHAEGPLDDWRAGTASLDVSALEARARDLPVRLSHPAQAFYEHGVAHVGCVDLDVGDTHLSAAGLVTLEGDGFDDGSADALHASITGDVSQILRALDAAGVLRERQIDATGPVALLARMTGSAQRPRIAADLDVGPASVTEGRLPPATSVRLVALVRDGWLDVPTLAADWQQSAIAAQGRVPLRFFDRFLPPSVAAALPGTTGTASLTARATSVTPAVLVPFVDADTLAQLKGNLDATIQLESSTATIEDLRGEVRLDGLALEVAGLPIQQREQTRVVFDGGFARVAAWDWVGQGATLGVKGQVRLADRQAGIIANGRVDLRTLTPFVRSLGMATAGTLEPHLSITGALEAPRINGDAALTAGDVRLQTPRLAVTDLEGLVVLSLNAAQLTSLHGSVNGGTLTGSGALDYAAGAPLAARLTTSARDVSLEFPRGLRSDVDADLTVTYAGAPPAPRVSADAEAAAHAALTGTVTIARSSYREPLALVTGLLTTLRTPSAAAGSDAGGDSFASRVALGVRVLTDDDLIVDNNYGRMQVGADLRVIGTAAAPSLSGRAELREGGQLFLGRNIYTIESGTIDFANPAAVEPDLNVVAQTHAGGDDIELPIKGTPEHFDMTPRSLTRPELGQADVWSLLLTGRELDAISGEEARVVGEQVLSYLSGDVLGIASRAVGLDTIRLGGLDRTTLRADPTAVAAETDPTSRLTFGKSIGRNVDLTFSQSFRESDAQTWLVDYRPSRELELRLVSRDDNLRSYEFRHDVPFGVARPSGVSAAAPARRGVRERAVTAVEFAGEIAIAEARLRAVLHVTPGDRLDYAEWQRDRDRVERVYWSEGYLEARVSARMRETGGGVTLAFRIDAGPKTIIAVTGFTMGAEVIAALQEAWSHAVFDGFLEDEAEEIVRRAMGEQGYLCAAVTATVSTRPGEKTLTVTIAAGDRTTERRVQVTGGPPDVEIERWMRLQRLDQTIWRDPAQVARDMTGYLRARGHAQAHVTAGAIRFEGASATVPVAVNAGPIFTIGRVALDRHSGPFTDDELREFSGLTSGMAYSAAVIETARDRVTARYRRQGFSTARVIARQETHADRAQIDVTLEIAEGGQQVLRDVSVEGNRAIDSDAVVRTLALPLGEPLASDAWLQARKRLFDSGLFRRVDVSAEPLDAAPADAAIQPMRVKVVVEEWPALRLRYGLQIAEERPEGKIEGRNLTPGLNVELTRRTLFRHAMTLGGAGVYRQRERRVRGFLSAPRFFGSQIRSSVSAERSFEEAAATHATTDLNRVSWEQRLLPVPRLQLSYSYSFEQNHTRLPSTNPFLPTLDVLIHVARLNGAAAFDTRNDPLETTRGLLVSASVEYAPKVLGSDIRFVRFVAQGYAFRPWKRMVLASAARLGTASALGGQELIVSERFFTGGARTVRGVDDESLGPHGFLGQPAGGGALLVLNQEVRFPVYRWLQGVGFVDAGNVFVAPSAMRLGDLVGSSGVGARLTSPFGTFRIDYGTRWSGGPGRWTFGIGQTF